MDSVAERSRIDIAKRNFIVGLETRNPQPWKGWFALPGLLLVGVVVWSQRRRLALQPSGEGNPGQIETPTQSGPARLDS
jgi:hypothetical protein